MTEKATSSNGILILLEGIASESDSQITSSAATKPLRDNDSLLFTLVANHGVIIVEILHTAV